MAVIPTTFFGQNVSALYSLQGELIRCLDGFLLRGNSCDSVNVDWAVEQNIIRGSKVALERLETAGFLGYTPPKLP